MTYEKALQSVLMYCVEECGKMDACRCENKECVEAAVIKALKKQIPKKPYDTEGCPLCKIGVELLPVDTEEVTYCLHCGQAIDWRMTNEKSKK